MSLIKNGDGVKVSTFESIQIGNDTYYVRQYVTLNQGDSIYWYNFDGNPNYDNLKLKLNDTVIIQADLYGYQGYIFGDWSSSIPNNMCLYMTASGYLNYYLGAAANSSTDYYCQVKVQQGVHIYGFSNGQCFCDNQILTRNSNHEELTSEQKEQYYNDGKTNDNYFRIGGAANYSFKLYRAIININETKSTYSYYPISNDNGTYVATYEALKEGALTAIHHPHSSVGPKVKYGISLDDIKSITGSNYRDLMAIITQDSGLSMKIGKTYADNPYSITRNGINHEFAFCLGDVPICGSNGAVRQNYKKGELIFGRRPKWNIWANSMPYSMWNRPETDYTQHYDASIPVYATYNIVDHWGKNGYVNLDWFNGYCYEDCDKPEVKFIDEEGNEKTAIKIYYHNSVVCNCTNETIMPGLCDDNPSGSHTVSSMFQNMFAADASIYNYDNKFEDSSVWMKLGNIVNWNRTQQQQMNEDMVNGVEPTFNQLVYGMAATLTHSFLTLQDNGNGGVYPDYVDILIGYANVQTRDRQTSTAQYIRDTPFIALSSESSADTIKRFKQGLNPINNEKIKCEQLRASGNEPVRLYNEILSAVDSSGNHTYTIDAVGSMDLLKRQTEIADTETPKESDLVHLNKFIQPTVLTIIGQIDKYQLQPADLRNYLNYVKLKKTNNYLFARDGYDHSSAIQDPYGGWSVRGTTNTTKLIFMNAIKETNPNFIHSDRLYTDNTAYYFFPLGIKAGTSDKYCYSHYKINSNAQYNTQYSSGTRIGGLFIPFTLLTKDFTTYSKIIDNYTSATGLLYTENNLQLRIIAEITQNIDKGNGEWEVKKDRVSKIVLRPSDISNDIEFNTDYIFTGSNYLNLAIGTENIWIGSILTTDLPNICATLTDWETLEYGDEFPTNITTKFWIQNETVASSIFTFDGTYRYNYINECWGKCIFGASLYVFIKDRSNEEWIHSYDENPNYFEDVIISHWLYGVKANVFTYSTTTPSSIGSVGTYDDPLSGVPNTWNDSLTTRSNSNQKLYMSERFFAKVKEPSDNRQIDINDRWNRSFSLIYQRYIEQKVFTDQVWQDPVEIKDDTDKQFIKIVLYIIEGDENVVKANPLNYIKYIENDGFYGVENGEILTCVFKYKVRYDSFGNRQSNSYSYRYYDQNGNQHLYDPVENVYYYSGFPSGGWTVINLYFDIDLNYLGCSDVYETSISTYNGNDKPDSSYVSISSYQKSDNSCGVANVYDYKVGQKYMFSKNSVLSPKNEPDKWDSFETAVTSSTASEYRFMYSEQTVFNIFGDCYKIYNLIQIKGDLEKDQYYPIRWKDVYKLNQIAQRYRDCPADNQSTIISESWYMLDSPYYEEQQSNQDYKPYLNKFISAIHAQDVHEEILAPYKINGLNVSINDIVEVRVPYSCHDQYYTNNKTCRFSITSPQYMSTGSGSGDTTTWDNPSQWGFHCVPKYYCYLIKDEN